MKFNFLPFVFGIIFLFHSYVRAQSLPDSVFQSAVQELIRGTEDDDPQELFDRLEYLKENPINVNTAAVSEFMLIPFLDELTANKILLFRKAYGQIVTLPELENCRAIDSIQYQLIAPFLITGYELKIKPEHVPDYFEKNDLHIFGRAMNRSIINPQFMASTQGDRNQFLFQFRASYQEMIKISLQCEKDPGENSLLDYYSGGIQYKASTILSVILGDYDVSFSKGIAMSSPFRKRRGAAIISSIKSNSTNVYLHTGTSECLFYRGAALNLTLKKFDFYVLYSSTAIDAKKDPVTNKITAIHTSGMHRTASEIEDNDQLREQVFGGILHFRLSDDFTIEMLSAYFKYSNFIEDPGYGFWNRFVNSFSFNANFENVIYSAEIAAMDEGINFAGNIILPVTNRLTVLASYRQYVNRILSLHSGGLHQFHDRPQNEKGAIFAFDYRGDGFRSALTIEEAKEITPENFVPNPRKYFAISSYSEYVLTRNVQAHLIFSMKKINDFELLDQFRMENNYSVYSARADIDLSINSRLSILSRFEYHSHYQDYAPNYTNSTLLSAQINYNYSSSGNAVCGLSLFRNVSSESMFYLYERDVPGVFSTTILSGDGTRWFIVLNQNIGQYFTVSGKYYSTSINTDIKDRALYEGLRVQLQYRR